MIPNIQHKLKGKVLLIVLLGGLALIFNIYILYKASISENDILSVGLVAFFAGLLCESFRVLEHWKTVALVFLIAYVLSLMAFIPRESENAYFLEGRIALWPYAFVFCYGLSFAMIYREKNKVKLTEGITLLQSLSLAYWIVDYGFARYQHWYELALLATVVLFSAFSVLNALTYIHLSENTRVILSIWSSIVMLTFAIDHIVRVFNHPDIGNSEHLSKTFQIGLQYFLLGTSAVYAIYNFMLLAAYIPSKHDNYKKNLQENKKEHLRRYSEDQVPIGQTLFCIFYALTLYGLNYTYQVLPRHTMIWFLFFTFPLMINLINLAHRPLSAIRER